VSPDLELALELADIADAITLPRFQAADLVVETKPDMTPVSEADRGVEQALLARLAVARPEHGVIGEEFGSHGSSAMRWIIDPIDGTKNYVRGIPIFATLIALEEQGEVTVGVASSPALGRRWWAARGEGAFANGRRLRVSAVSRLADAQLCYGSIDAWVTAGMLDRFLDLGRACWRTRGFGDYFTHMMVAEGSAEIALEGPGIKLWDMAAPKVIVEEAGGRVTDLAGAPMAGTGTVSTNGLLHQEVLAALGPPPG
jgi:histidinol-phosphatase